MSPPVLRSEYARPKTCMLSTAGRFGSASSARRRYSNDSAFPSVLHRISLNPHTPAGARTHRWSFTTMTKATVLLEGGPERFCLDSPTPYFMSYTVTANRVHDGCPATTFRLDSVAVITPADYQGGKDSVLLRAWEDAEPGRVAMDRSFRQDNDPAFAGVVALLNSARLDAGLPPLGFLNPLIYAHPGAFNDVAAGDNPGCGTRGFSARAGWDPITGVGTPNFAKLRDTVAQAAGAV